MTSVASREREKRELLPSLLNLERKTNENKEQPDEGKLQIARKYWSSFLEDFEQRYPEEFKDFYPQRYAAAKELTDAAAKALSNAEVMKTPLRFRGIARYVVGLQIFIIGRELENEEITFASAETISKYKGFAAVHLSLILSDKAGKIRETQEMVKQQEASSQATNRDESLRAVLREQPEQSPLNNYAEELRLFSLPEIIEFISRRGRSSRLYPLYLFNSISFVIDALSEFKHAEDVIKTVNIAKRIGYAKIDIVPRSYLFKSIKEGYGDLLRNQKSLAYIALYLHFREELPAPTSNTLENAEEIVSSYLQERYGLRDGLRLNEATLLLGAKDPVIALLLANQHPRHDVIEYPLKMTSLAERKQARDIYFKAAVVAIVGSKDKQKEAEARTIIRDIVGKPTLDRARNEFNLYLKHLLPDIIKLMPDYASAAQLLAVKAMHASDPSGKPVQLTGIMSILNIRYQQWNNYISYAKFTSNAKILRASETKNPLEYDFRIQEACVYLPNSEHILNYAENDKCVLVKYEAVTSKNKAVVIGSAICYVDKRKFLVDSIEGHPAFADYPIFNTVYEDLIARARKHNCDLILFGKNGLNQVPKEFINYLETKNLQQIEVDMDLPTNRDELYLETKKGEKAFALRIAPASNQDKLAAGQLHEAG